MQSKPHTTAFTTILVGVVLALTVSAPAAFANPTPQPPVFPSAVPAEPGAITGATQPPVFPSAVPAEPGAITGATPVTQAARAQERYYSSYGHPTPLARPAAAPADGGGTDWAAIGISLGATCLLAGAVIALVARTARRTHRVRIAA